MKDRIPITVLFIAGSYPPDICGVGDYTYMLYHELEKYDSQLQLHLFHRKNWSLKFFWRYLKDIKAYKTDLIHLQYPTEGFGYSFMPLLIMMFLKGRNTITTLHELSSRTNKAKLFTYVLAFFSKHIVVTNETEETLFKSKFLFKRKRIAVINIGSNIPTGIEHNRPFYLRKTDLIYFGHIRPLKGLSMFMEVVGELRKQGNLFKSVIMGQTLEKYEAYFDSLQKEAFTLDIELIINKDRHTIADYLSNSKITYLPFPDGVSTRRGSLIAAAMNNCSIVTTCSQSNEVNAFFEPYCYLTADKYQATKTIADIIANPSTPKDLSQLATFFSWENISKRHIQFYKIALSLTNCESELN